VCFIVHKITLELEHTILITLYLADEKNTDNAYMVNYNALDQDANMTS
jgi:hypothetical protein